MKLTRIWTKKNENCSKNWMKVVMTSLAVAFSLWQDVHFGCVFSVRAVRSARQKGKLKCGAETIVKHWAIATEENLKQKKSKICWCVFVSTNTLKKCHMSREHFHRYRCSVSFRTPFLSASNESVPFVLPRVRIQANRRWNKCATLVALTRFAM